LFASRLLVSGKPGGLREWSTPAQGAPEQPGATRSASEHGEDCEERSGAAAKRREAGLNKRDLARQYNEKTSRRLFLLSWKRKTGSDLSNLNLLHGSTIGDLSLGGSNRGHPRPKYLEALFGLQRRNALGSSGLVDNVVSTKLLALNARIRLVNCINDHRMRSSLPLYSIHVLTEQIDKYSSTNSLSSYVGTLLEEEPS